MCCIIHRPKDAKKIPDYRLTSINRINDDGWGLSYIDEKNEIQVVKSLDMNKSIERITELEDRNVEFLYHARWATHGDTSVENCHPFSLSNGVLFHNGKIDIKCPDSKLSDTYYFAKKVDTFLKRKRSIDWILNILKKQIGESRLAFLTGKGEIIRHGKWIEIDGCYYSKDNWRYTSSGYSVYDYSSSVQDDYSRIWNAFEPKMKRERSTPANDYTFESVLEDCEDEKEILAFQMRRLNAKQLTVLSVNYPELCANFLVKHIH